MCLSEVGGGLLCQYVSVRASVQCGMVLMLMRCITTSLQSSQLATLLEERREEQTDEMWELQHDVPPDTIHTMSLREQV